MTTYYIPIKTVSEANRRDHWAVRHRRSKSQRRSVGLMIRPHPLPCSVTMTRLAPRMLDEGDNLNISMKAVRDAIADKLGLPNDRDPRVSWHYGQEKSKEYGVRVDIDD